MFIFYAITPENTTYCYTGTTKLLTILASMSKQKRSAYNCPPPDKIRSYGVMSADSVINGAYIVQAVGYSWVVQSPREEIAYIEAKIS